MPHGHGPAGENPEEIQVFADSILKQEKPLPRIQEQGTEGDKAWAVFQSDVTISKAELCFTRKTGRWQDREWESIPADIDTVTSRVSATVSSDATVFYLNLIDERDCVVSTMHVER